MPDSLTRDADFAASQTNDALAVALDRIAYAGAFCYTSAQVKAFVGEAAKRLREQTGIRT
jgi:hypothetical protein